MSEPPFFSLVIPTYNEAENIVPLLEALSAPLSGRPHEIIVADDDSPDRTWEAAQRFAAAGQGPVKVLRRLRDRGLSAAVVEAFAGARGAYLGVMDADFSHDPALWPRLLEALDQGAELAVGSRRVPGGGADKWPRHRRFLSDLGTVFSRVALGVSLRDPMSGFFAVRREAYERGRARVHPRGYKILLEVAVKSAIPPSKTVEVPYVFRDRRQGHSKLTPRVALGFLSQVADLVLHRGRQ